MVRRVLLGLRGSGRGLWVSRPGVDVVTAADDDLLFSSSDSENLMIIESGTIADPGAGASIAINITDMGFAPFVIVSCERYPVSIEYVSNSRIRFRTFSAPSFNNDSTSGTNVQRSGQIRYAVTNLPV
jgi:hypothetical protein